MIIIKEQFKEISVCQYLSLSSHIYMYVYVSQYKERESRLVKKNYEYKNFSFNFFICLKKINKYLAKFIYLGIYMEFQKMY